MTTTTQAAIFCQVRNESNTNGTLQTFIDCQEGAISVSFACNETSLCLNPERDVCYDENEATTNVCTFDCSGDRSRCRYEKTELHDITTPIIVRKPTIDCSVTDVRIDDTFATQTFSISLACENGLSFVQNRPLPPCTSTDFEEIIAGQDSNSNNITCIFNCTQSRAMCSLKYIDESQMVQASETEELPAQARPEPIGFCEGESVTNSAINQSFITFKCPEQNITFEWTGECDSDEQKILSNIDNATLTCLFNCSKDSVAPRCQLVFALPDEGTNRLTLRKYLSCPKETAPINLRSIQGGFRHLF